ncbi:YebC/PmpR family DNA-binding transcriptional regulator [Synechocystis sp. PCC 7339]|uniref:YebC/PmpR family DNA-binding transcriptional regulator n=1 Tax=unclassified Synechocystis TaxID=2640012 RepID=UPI001BB03F59|nr:MULTISPECIES: YebC/PmpR family DNA-binding transcriptional regulator [unclassified Synechocystis]QUS59676.1 YebC/PmpR family DNA-binding transcriptional regulator [Synechocystis sp. PCC 7338]UAJ71878.1 YebC/PmpR family DNA-binding transcriptional regulator [Synechocystis sp. PCC 7339]
MGGRKWQSIKRQKARVDAQKGKTTTQLSRAIIVAARQGLPDPAGNFQLRTAIEKARAAGVPNDSIDRAIAKGAGTYEDGESNYEEMRYEGYGPGGVAVLIEALTDNRNRTAADLRAAFSKKGGNLGETGCVSWMFSQKGAIRLEGELEEEKLLEALLEGEGESYEWLDEEDGGGVEVFSAVSQLESLNQVLQNHGFAIAESELRWLPENTMEIADPDQAKALMQMIETLESLDDVQSVTSNFELTEELLALAG